MIITIHALPQPSTAMSRAERAMVGYLARLHERQGDVLLLSVRRAIEVTGLKRGQIQRALARLELWRAVMVEEALAA